MSRVKLAWPTSKPSKIWKSHEDDDIVEALSYYAATKEADRRSQVVCEKGSILDEAKGAGDSIPPPGLFKKNSRNQNKDRKFFGWGEGSWAPRAQQFRRRRPSRLIRQQ
ncbi:MAG: hypothetical protein EZS28_014243 [Streblomastix strix]|uniref:Uncharacterized protein n=1 Tax=Streblomastix strix TaxID=222440 RepID=A0A5J4W5N5_9EUKA|nr:MAG: hypothetical protein EZS28_014243 [Streblomastix strix]